MALRICWFVLWGIEFCWYELFFFSGTVVRKVNVRHISYVQWLYRVKEYVLEFNKWSCKIIPLGFMVKSYKFVNVELKILHENMSFELNLKNRNLTDSKTFYTILH